MRTMPPHLGQAKIFPIISGFRTFNEAPQVVQRIENGATPIAFESSGIRRRFG